MGEQNTLVNVLILYTELYYIMHIYIYLCVHIYVYMYTLYIYI